MPKKLQQRNFIQAELEEWYEDEEDFEEDRERTSQRKGNERATIETLSEQSTIRESAVEEVRKVLSDSFSLDTIRRALDRVQCNPNLAVGLLLDEAADSFQSSLPEQVGQGDPADPENTTVDESLAKSRQNKSKDIVCSQQKTTSKIRESHCAVEPEKESTFHPFHHGQVEPAQTESSLEVGYCTNPVILVLGHVDVGKSTFLGHILHLTGNIDERMLRKLKKESSDSGRSDLSYAWVLDDQEAERERGVTMDISIRQVHFKRLYTFLDTPGHYDFLSAVIAAASQAQVAILLVDASPGQFETCFMKMDPLWNTLLLFEVWE
ncbi:eukaryotic translation elongation factor 1 alpha (eEF-1a) [Galdieria sulphuraria]|uniref:Eukaryotic translation elongation factor 1 alpha (EEF-1a) n=1 Tax=Galdieria sulphuraria TaxID=130081 RepID=M2WQ99_GALSU|nr:eukaryotic translation elongation factor 1 alpha (eEF-1a) [Galdieria sulphuraria]EME25950.1 eukaryotic translation elongation factor 1 alpha (eEF-1a) [Galdieria sulphuraria]|eukprot:XP_005702470.1 eukaryotic translation elongation factor 1 alpha (eEF-1a) [Galdieria sulphuraria]